MSAPDVRLYAVTDAGLVAGERLVSACVAAARGGATLVQLRDKTASDEDLLVQAVRLREALEPFGVPLVVNDRIDVAHRAGVGVHVGLGDTAPSRARALLGAEAIVGWSIETPEQLDSEQASACSYVAASPVWSTPTKPDTAVPLGPAGVAAVRARTRLPLVGIGGIDSPVRAAEVIEAGADGIAVVSAIFQPEDPRMAALALRAAVDDALAAGAPTSHTPLRHA